MNSSKLLKQFKALSVAISIALAPSFSFALGDREEGMANETPKELQGIGFDDKLGAVLNRDVHFNDDQGRDVTLGKYLNGSKPLVLSLAYYNCPGLCNFHLNGMTEALRDSGLKMGRDFDYVVVSFDAREKSQLAGDKKKSYLRLLGDASAASGWHFLTGEQPSIAALSKNVGFKFRWDEQAKEFAHASAAILITPEGKISRYLPGITFDPKTVRLAVLEASNGKVGNVIDRFMLFCFHYDPKQSKYVVAAMRVMRIAGVLMVLILAVFIAPYWWRQRRNPNGARLQGEVL